MKYIGSIFVFLGKLKSKKTNRIGIRIYGNTSENNFKFTKLSKIK